jgi:hypothetical protein
MSADPRGAPCTPPDDQIGETLRDGVVGWGGHVYEEGGREMWREGWRERGR